MVHIITVVATNGVHNTTSRAKSVQCVNSWNCYFFTLIRHWTFEGNRFVLSIRTYSRCAFSRESDCLTLRSVALSWTCCIILGGLIHDNILHLCNRYSYKYIYYSSLKPRRCKQLRFNACKSFNIHKNIYVISLCKQVWGKPYAVFKL